MIYGILAVDSGRVKIGYSESSPENRLSALTTASPERLLLVHVENGEREDEAALHERFKAARLHGEWFSASEELYRWLGLEWDDSPKYPKPVIPALRGLAADAARLAGVKKKTSQAKRNYRVARKQWKGNLRQLKNTLGQLKDQEARLVRSIEEKEELLRLLEASEATLQGEIVWRGIGRLIHRQDGNEVKFTGVKLQPHTRFGECFWLGMGHRGEDGVDVVVTVARASQ